GVTPLIAMAHELHAAGADFDLYYKSRTRAQAAFIPELQAMPWAERVHFHFSDERRLDIADVLNQYRDGSHVYTCGPAAFMDAVFETASGFGWPEEALHREYFSVQIGRASCRERVEAGGGGVACKREADVAKGTAGAR